MELSTDFALRGNMANCPNCGSSHIHLKTETNVNWGRAVAGWALFGVVGGAVGAVTGDDRNVNACLDCGTSWKATDLYKTLQTIKSLTGVTLDLANEQHRLYMNKFMNEVGSCIEAASTVDKEANKLISNANGESLDKTAKGCDYGCLTSIGGCVAAAKVASDGDILWVLLLPPVIGFCIGLLLDRANKKSVQQQIVRAEREAERMRIEAEENLQLKLRGFIESNPL